MPAWATCRPSQTQPPIQRAAQTPRLRLPFDLPAMALERADGATRSTRSTTGTGGASRVNGWWIGTSYFYPLDAVLDWNRGYGRAGFIQFQCALPQHAARAGDAMPLLGAIARSGEARCRRC